MPDLNEHQFGGWGEEHHPFGKPEVSIRKSNTSNERDRGRRDARAAQHAHDLQREDVTKGYKTEGKLYDQDHTRPTVHGHEQDRKKYEDSVRYNDV